MDLAGLNKQFGIAGVLAFEEDRALTRMRITTSAAQAIIYLQGAHLTAWQPSGTEPVIFLSSESEFGPGKAIRGGIPVVFPWFAADRKLDRVNGHPGPSHGFARIQEWTVDSAVHRGSDVVVRLSLGPTDMSRLMGFADFLLTLEFVVGAELRVLFTVKNTSVSAPLAFEEALHAYFRVTDVHEATVSGLEATSFVDKTDGGVVKPPSGAPVVFKGPVDRVYLDTEATCTIHDPLQRRALRVEKIHSQNTVVFNPYRALPDLGEWDWQNMLCVETANVAAHGPVLAPGAAGQMGMHVTVAPQKAG